VVVVVVVVKVIINFFITLDILSLYLGQRNKKSGGGPDFLSLRGITALLIHNFKRTGVVTATAVHGDTA